MISPEEKRANWLWRYMVAATPVLLTLQVWAMGLAAYHAGGCRSGVKSLGCAEQPQWVWWLAATGDFWMPLAIWATGPLSLALLAGTFMAQLRSKR